MRTHIKWHRLLVNPTTHLESQEGNVTRLRVDGLVCSSICAVRTKRALESLGGVGRVTVDFDLGVATIVGDPHEPADYEAAVRDVVAGRLVRRVIQSWAKRVRRISTRPRSASGA
ncbi:MAG TPA: heavy metal-associated domain-containing protein [Dehalococcoidia bacterium]|nr:heavy metal-associated domain-containing protein [Dehalococcoidia bacterium]